MKNVKLFEEFLNEEHRSLTEEQKDFLNSVVQGTWEINSQGLIDVNGTVSILEKTIKKFPVKFGTVSGDFICMDCPSLTSLKGAPQKVDRSFYCLRCTSLVSLEGAPQKVKGDFSCSGCTSLRTLEGAPREVGEDFSCVGCTSLTSLEGAPEKVGENFFCRNCHSLVSLKGAPREISGHFDCVRCTSLKTLKDAPYIVEGHFSCSGCTSLPQEELDLIKNEVLREAWLKSGLSFEEFKKQKKGLIAAKNFGF